MIFENLFWLSSIGAIYSYAIYPAALKLTPNRLSQPAPVAKNVASPCVTVIVSCRNEEKRLDQKLRNTMALNYPNLEIIVASDCSEDASDSIVASYANVGIRLVRSAERRGKEFAQGLALQESTGDIVVFSDAGTDTPLDSIGFIVQQFADPRIGAVSSEDLFLGPNGTLVGEGAYVRYEMWLRRLESARAGLVGLSGSFFAVKRSVIKNWSTSIPSDFACAMAVVKAGLTSVSDPRVRGIYTDIKDPTKEYGRKVRTAIRGIGAVANSPEVLNPFRFGWFSFQVWSHKVMRWLVPWFLLGCLFTSLVLAHNNLFYFGSLVLQIIFYGVCLSAHYMKELQRLTPIRLAYFFVTSNIALAEACVRFLLGTRITVWEPSQR